MQIPSINTYTALEDLVLDGCTLLTQLQLLLPRLQRASFARCPALATVGRVSAPHTPGILMHCLTIAISFDDVLTALMKAGQWFGVWVWILNV